MDFCEPLPMPLLRPQPAETTSLDEGRWRALHTAYAPFLLRVTQRHVGGRAEVQDIVQDTFLAAYKRQDDLPRDEQALKVWLYRTCQFKIQHHKRTTARFLGLKEHVQAQHVGEPALAPASADATVQKNDAQSRLGVLMAALPFAQREVFVLYELEELNGPEIAALIGETEHVVRGRLRQARMKLSAMAKTLVSGPWPAAPSSSQENEPVLGTAPQVASGGRHA